MPIQQSSLAQAVLDEERRQRERAEQRAAESLFAARPQSPDRAALAQQAASVLGRAPIEIDENAEREAQAARELEALRGHHATINWLSDPENAAVGHDQVEQLTLIERMALGARTGTLGLQTAIGLGDLGRRAVEGLGLGLGAITRGAGTLAELDALSRGMGGQAAVGRRLAAAGERMELGARNLGGTLTREDLRLWTAADQQPLPQAATDTGFVGDVASGLGQISGQVAVAVATGGTLTIPSLFAQGVGSMDERVDQRRESEGRPEGSYTSGEVAALLGAGVVTGLSEKVGLDAVLGRLPKPIQQRLTNRFADILVAGVVEGSSEVVEGVGHNALARYALGEDGGLLDGTVEGGSVGAAVGSIARALALTAIPGRQHIANQIRAEAAQTEAERFDQLVDIVASNPLMNRSPERLQAFLAQVGDGRAVYVPAEAAATFFQSDPANEALLDEWGIRDQYEQALASGADIAIDASVYLTKVAQTPGHAAWREELRHGLEAMSLREAAEFAASGEQRLTEELDTAVEAAEALSREETPERRVYDDWFSQGRAAGLIREVADANAQVVAAMFARRAARSGGRFADAWAAYRDANLTIARQFPESLRAERTDARLMTLYTALKSGRAAPSQRAMFGRSLAEFVSSEGGIFDTGGELAAMGADQWHRQQRFRRKLVRADDAEGKFGADYVAERAVAAGYLPEGATGNDLLEALREEIAGRPVFATNADLDPAAAENAQALDDLEELLANAGLNAQTATYEEVKAAVDRLADAPTTPPGVAYEQGQQAARALAQTYKALAGIAKSDFVGPVQPVEADMVRIADAFEAAEHAPNDPEVAAAYEALIGETVAQFLMMGDIKVEAWRGEGEPYANSRAMLEDVQQNGHLWFFLTEAGFGEGADTSGHPLLAKTGLTLEDGTELVANDVFRIVHDYFGHAQQGFNFGPVGELNAYLEHASMYSDAALPALAAETLMQNAWVNFGPHLRREDGSLPKRGEEGYTPIPQRRFADQKAFLAPPEVMELAEKAKGDRQPLEQPDGTDQPRLTRPPVNPDGTITLRHYSRETDLTETDPTMWGRNAKIMPRAERAMIGSHLPRTYFGIGVGQPGGYRVEFAGAQEYIADIPADRLYDVAADPDGFRQRLDGVPQWDRVNQIERMVAEKYDGYWLKNELGLTATVFKPMKVQRADQRALEQGEVDPRSAAFRGWFGDSKVVDENGEPLVVYHGTTADFDAFDRSRANVESDLGAGFYFSNNPADVGSNYAGEGPDLTSKIERTIEQLQNEDDELSFAEANAIARRQHGVEHRGATLPVYLSIQNPVVIGGADETRLDYDEGYDPEADEYGEPSGALIDFAEAVREELEAEDTFDGDADRAISDLLYDVDDGLSVSDAIERLKASEGVVYTTDENGDLISGEIIRRAFAAIGFDGIIDRTVDVKFGSQRRTGKAMEGMEPGTTHYVAFRPEQIKSVFNRGTFDPADTRILFQSDDASPPFFSALLRAVENSQTKRAPAAQWKATLAKVPGVKKEEIEWSGLNEWLDDAEGPVDRDSVAAFLRAGGVRVDEVVLGEQASAEDVEAEVERRLGELRDELYANSEIEPPYYVTEIEPDEDADEPGGWAVRLLEGGEVDRYDTEQEAQGAADEANLEYERDVVAERLDDERASIERQVERDLGESNAQFADWKLPGADDTYREVLLTLPNIEGPSTHWDTQNVVAHARLTERTDAEGKRVLFIEEVQSDWHQKGRDQGYRREASEEERVYARIAYEDALAAQREAREPYRQAVREVVLSRIAELEAVREEARAAGGSVWETVADQINLLKDAVTSLDAGSEPTMILNRGSLGLIRTPEVEAAAQALPAFALRVTEARAALDALDQGIPDAPFRTSWPALVMKRMIRWAVDHGYERVAWTTGRQQSERYNLGQAVGELSVRPSRELVMVMGRGMERRAVVPDTYDVVIENHRARETVRAQLSTTYDNDNAIRMTPAQMAEVFGRDVADRLVAQAAELTDPYDFAYIRDADLNVGGEGMRAFYDRNLVNITNDIVKRYGARVGPVDMEPPSLKRWRELEREIAAAIENRNAANEALDAELDKGADTDYREADRLNAEISRWDVEARRLSSAQRNSLPPTGAQSFGQQPGFDITPQLREAAMSGFPLFQKGRAKGPRGQVDFSDPERAAITLFSGADPTTPFHEAIGHVSLELLIRDAADPASTEEMQRDLALVLDYLNVRDPRDIGREQHELWASTVERYFMEGRAPSLALRDVMNRIRSWFVSIYKRLTHPQVNVPITDEVRSVLDRMLASEEEIAAAREAMKVEAGFADAAAAGMTEAAFADYQRLVERARGDAEDELLRRMMRVIRQRRTEEWNAEADAIRPDVVAEIDAQPDIRALNWLRGNKVALNREVVVRMLGDEAGLKLLPKGVPPLVGKNGVHPDSVAEVAGYNSGMELLDGLMTLEAEKRSMVAAKDNRSVRQARIDREIERRVNELLGDPLTDGSIEAEAMAALHTERQAEVLAVELSVLQRRVGTTPPPLAALRSWAREQIGRRTVREARSGKYLRAERAAANAVQRALAAGDRREAARQKQAQTLNHLLYSEARKAEDFAAAAVRRLSKLDQKRTLRSMDQEYLEQIHALLEQYDLRQASGVQVQRRKGLMEFVNERLAMGEEVFVPQELFDAASKRHYSELTVDELRALDDTVRSLAHLGRLKQTLLDNRDRRDFEQVIDELLSQVQDLPARKGLEGRNRRENGLRQIDAALWKMETLFDWLDKDDIGGVFNRVLLRPAVDAANRNDQLHESVGRAIREVYEAVPRDQKKRWLDKVSAPELTDRETGEPSQFVRSDLIAMALNVGNASNLDKLTRGEEWTPEDVMTVLNRELTAEEWRFVQGIWDALETLWPEIARVERILTGVEPERVDPMPVKTTTAGELRGGYYPVKYDRSRNPDAARWDAAEAADLFNNVITGAATPKGHTMSRSGYAGPVLLSVEGVLFGHISNVIARVSHGEYVQSALKFIRDPRVRQVVEKKVGPEYYAQLEPWLKSQVTDRARNNRDLEGIEKFVKRARLNFQMVAMGLRVTTGLAQVAGLAVSAGVVNPARLGVAVARYAMSIRLGRNDLSDFAFEKSEELRQRMRSRDRDIRDAMRDLIGKSGVIPTIQQAAFYHIGIMDQFVSVPTWLAAYEDAIARGVEEADAVAAGDKAVRLSQGTGREYALAAVQRPNSEFMKLFTLFYSFFSVQYQRQRDVVRATTTGDTAKAISLTFWVFVMGPLLGALLTGDGPDEDDGEGLEAWLAWGARKAFFNLFTGVPFVRDATGFLERKIAGEYAEYAATPLNRIGSSLFRAGEVGWDAATGEDVSPKWLKQVMEPIGYVVGLPTGQLANTTQYVKELFDGTQEPDNLAEFAYGLAKGPQTDQE